MQGDLVVANAEIKYRSPLTGAIRCRTRASEEDCQIFQKSFESNAKSKLVLGIEVGDSGNAVLQATYVALSNT